MKTLSFNQAFTYSENNKEAGTKQVCLNYAGFSMSNKFCFYIDGSSDLFYMSQTSFDISLKTGILKYSN